MRLLYLNHNYRYLGTYERAWNLARGLARRGHQVTLMTVSRQHRWKPTVSIANGVRVVEMPNWGQNYSGEGYGPLDNLLRCLHALIYRYDIIHMFDHKPNASFAGFVGRLRGAKLIADWADWWGGPGGINDVPKRRVPAIGKFEEWWEIKSKLWADGVVTISTVLRQRALDIGCPAERLICIPNGAATDLIRCLPVAEARQRLGVPLDRKIVGFLGMGQGDMEIVMPAIRQLPDVWFMVIGPKNQRVLEQAHAFGIGDRLWQTDFVPDEELSWYLACADVMCLPLTDRAANRGRLPGKIMYYMAAGRPTVASPVGDVVHLVETYRIGLLAANQEEFAHALWKLLTDDALRRELGQNARKAAEIDLNWERRVEELEAFYQRILNMP
ncbi:glycosyltransferase family 4 protein [Thermoflexus sp.]|uniref:glycosyltransferase family 4 protein n=1 Tax=Thermoflexus sp. TaxID=1969742 RepID=UPI0035E45D8F